jgi:hypothetical protein
MNLMDKYRRKFEETPQVRQSEPDRPPADLKEEEYEERAAIMQFDGGLDRGEAERLAWCRTACMLFAISQWEMCERFKPKPCLKLIEYRRDHA